MKKKKIMIVATMTGSVFMAACGTPAMQNVLQGGHGVGVTDPDYKRTVAEVSEYQDVMQDISVYQSYATMRAEQLNGDFENVEVSEEVKKDGVLTLDKPTAGVTGNSQKQNNSGEQSATASSEQDAGLAATTDLSKYAGIQLRFDGFGTLQVSEQNPEVVLANDNECEMYVKIYVGKKASGIYGDTYIFANQSTGYDLYDLLGGKSGYVTMVWQPFDAKGTYLNSMVQTVKVEVVKEGEPAEEKRYAGALPGDTFTTKVSYDTSHVHCVVTLPAVISVAKGSYGTDITVGYEITNAEKATTVTVQTNAKVAGVGVQDASLKWTNFVLSGGEESDDTHTALSYEFPKTQSQSHAVGPIHCMPEGGGRATSDYYGVTEFVFTLEQ